LVPSFVPYRVSALMKPEFGQMKKIAINFLTFLLFSLALISCCGDDVSTGEKVELYLLEYFETVEQTCQIDESTIVINKNPLLYYSDFISYNSKEYTFKLSERGRSAIGLEDFPVTGLPFAIVVNNEIIYTGYFWPGYSSASCQWIVTDPISLYSIDEMRIQLGYPGQIDGISIPDHRNDPRLLYVFRRDGKLIE